mgnify:CR=1 FL=1
MDPMTIALGLLQFAPSLLRYFGAGEKPAAVADKVVEIARTVTGAATGPEALEAIRANAAQAAAFQQAVLEADTTLEQAYLADRRDARARDVALHQAGFHNTRADLMVLFDVIGLIACLLVLSVFRKEIPGEVVSLLSTIAGIFGLCLRDAHQFEFGSSRGSKEKDALLAGSNR